MADTTIVSKVQIYHCPECASEISEGFGVEDDGSRARITIHYATPCYLWKSFAGSDLPFRDHFRACCEWLTEARKEFESVRDQDP